MRESVVVPGDASCPLGIALAEDRIAIVSRIRGGRPIALWAQFPPRETAIHSVPLLRRSASFIADAGGHAPLEIRWKPVSLILSQSACVKLMLGQPFAKGNGIIPIHADDG